MKAKTLTAVRFRNLPIERELKIVHRTDKHLSRAALAFIELAGRELDRYGVVIDSQVGPFLFRSAPALRITHEINKLKKCNYLEHYSQQTV